MIRIRLSCSHLSRVPVRRLLKLTHLLVGLELVTFPGNVFAHDDSDVEKSTENSEDQESFRCYSRGKRTSLVDEIRKGHYQPYLMLESQWGDVARQSHQVGGVSLGVHEHGESLVALTYLRSLEPVKIPVADKVYNVEATFWGLAFGGVSERFQIFDGYGRLLIAGGKMTARSEHEEHATRNLMLLQPELGMNINITSFLQLGVGASYQWLGNARLHTLGYGDLAGWRGHVHLTLGSVE